MSDKKKKGRKRGIDALKSGSQPESGKPAPREFEASVPAKEPEIVPEKVTPAAKPEAAKAEGGTDVRKKLLKWVENGILILGFLIMGVSLFGGQGLRDTISSYVDIVVGPIVATMPFYIVVLAIAAIVTVLSTFVQKYTMDWELMRRVTLKNQALSKEMREAQLAGNKAKIKKLQDEQMAGMQDQSQLSKQQLKPMGFIMIVSVPLFFWAYWYLAQHPELTMVFPFAGTVTLLQGAFFIFPWWIVWSMLCSFGISQVIRKAFNVGIAS